MYLIRPLICYLVHHRWFLLFLHCTILEKKGTVNICHVSEDKQLCYIETMTETEKSHTDGVADKSNSRKAALLIPLYHALKQ